MDVYVLVSSLSFCFSLFLFQSFTLFFLWIIWVWLLAILVRVALLFNLNNFRLGARKILCLIGCVKGSLRKVISIWIKIRIVLMILKVVRMAPTIGGILKIRVSVIWELAHQRNWQEIILFKTT